MKGGLRACLAAVAGACALSTAALWYWRSWDGGLSVPPLPQGDMLDISELMGLAVLGTMFQFATPALSAVAWALGWGTRRHRTAKAGMAMAAAAMALYVLYVRACLSLLQD